VVKSSAGGYRQPASVYFGEPFKAFKTKPYKPYFFSRTTTAPIRSPFLKSLRILFG
jgi:hypothetical protein